MKFFYTSALVSSLLLLSGCGDGASTGNPQITLKGSTDIKIPMGATIDEYGFTASDVKDGDVTDRVSRTNNIDFYKPGTYQITYTVTDSDGNRAQAVRNVTILGSNGDYYNGGVQYKGAVPKITFPDGDPVYLRKGESFEGSYSATDFEDGDLTAKVEVLHAGIDKNTPPGVYAVVYKVTDSAGNLVEKKRTVFVGDYGSGSSAKWNGISQQDIESFATWYSTTCGKTFNRSKYNANTGYYDGAISCRDRNLDRIDLSDMKIFSTIKRVDFSHNHLSTIDLSPFYSTNIIEKVDLSHNDFEHLDFRPLYELKNINELWINDNRLNYTKEERIDLYKGFNNRSFKIFF